MSLDKLTSSSAGNAATPAKGSPPRRRRSVAWLLPVGLLVGFIAILAWLFGDRLVPAVEVKTARVVTLRKGAGDADPPATAQTRPDDRGSLLFQASGWVEPDPYTIFVPTLVNGVVKSVHVLEGQAVKKGDLLATLVDDDAQLDLRQATQQVRSQRAAIDAHCMGTDIAKAGLEAAKKKVAAAKARVADAVDHHNRLKKIPAGAIPGQQLVQAALKVRQQRAMLAEAETELPRLEARLGQIDRERIAMEAKAAQLETARDRAQLALDRTRISSPMDGMVLRLHVAPGKKRMLDMEEPTSAVVVELYDPEKLQARIDVPLNEAAALRVGQQVELLSDLLPETVFNGRVTRITGEADLQRNTLQAKVEITNPDSRLRPEMLVRAKFFATGGQTAGSTAASPGRLSIYVPESAVIDNQHVWVVSPDHRADFRSIKLGSEVRDGHRLVISGVHSGEQVILPPHDQLEPGARVNPSLQPNN